MNDLQITLQWIWPLVAIIAALVEGYYDAKGKITEHALSASFRVFCAISISWWMFYWTWTPYYYTTLYTGILLVTFWIVFDPFYNIIRDGNVWYIGETAKLDKLARKIVGRDGMTYLALKVVILIALLTAYSF